MYLPWHLEHYDNKYKLILPIDTSLMHLNITEIKIYGTSPWVLYYKTFYDRNCCRVIIS